MNSNVHFLYKLSIYSHLCASFELEEFGMRFSFPPTKLSQLYFKFTFLFPGSEKGALELPSTMFPPFIFSLQSPTHLSTLNLLSRCCQLMTALQRVENRDPVILCKVIFVHSGDLELRVSETNSKAVCNQIISEVRSHFYGIFIKCN